MARQLAYALPYRRFADALTDANARLGADAVRYAFIVTDFHHLFLAGLPAHWVITFGEITDAHPQGCLVGCDRAVANAPPADAKRDAAGHLQKPRGLRLFVARLPVGSAMLGQAGFFDVDERLKELSSKGDALERLSSIVDFDLFRPDLTRAVPRSARAKGDRPPFDLVFMFNVLILQASHSLLDKCTEFPIKDRLSFMRFLSLRLSELVPEANTIWTFRERLTPAQIDSQPAIRVLFSAFEAALRNAGFLAIGGQIVDATAVAAPKQRNTEAGKAELKAGRVPGAWQAKLAKLAQKDHDARWTIKWSRAKPAEDGSKRVDIAVPAFGYKNHIGIDRRHRLIRTQITIDATRHDGAQLPGLLSKANTASAVWADTAYRSKQNEAHLSGNGFVSRIHRKKPPGKPLPRNLARANGRSSTVRAAVKHVFARQKGPMGLFVRTIGSAWVRVKIGLANLAYNMKWAVWLDRSRARMA